jgi:hypothetical protein
MPKGVAWDELKVSAELLKYRAEQKVNQGASFTTIGTINQSLHIRNTHP